MRLTQVGVPLGSIDRLFLTHLHSDHIIQIPDLLLTGWFGRRVPLEVWGPDGTQHMMDHMNGESSEVILPQMVIEMLYELTKGDAIITTGVGQHQMWASQFIEFDKPGTWLNSGGAGTMGYAVPAAMGAKVGRPGATVWAIDGDGCFQMTNQELATCALEGIPIKVALINNGNLGMVRQWQTLFYNERYSHTDLDRSSPGAAPRSGPPAVAEAAPLGTRIPDFVKLAEAYGCAGLRCEDAAAVDKVLEEAMKIDDRPVVIDFVVHRDAMVWPMVAAGTSNDDIKVARDMAPQWDREEEGE